ncbi:Uncharacterised protein [Salmonella enterica subsp. enterica serovar Bovismorbificans]|nr:Uncharacterised protein [Salmonella enterica subsp. enterica serovar Bovismorbificans]
MGAHHWRKGAEIAPAQQQLFAAFHVKQGGVAADIAVMQTVAGHRQRQCRRHDRGQTIIKAPVNVLVACPHHGGIFLTAGVTRTHKEQDLAELAGLL